VTIENSSSVTGNTASVLGPDVENLSVLYLDGTSTIGILDGNSAIPKQQVGKQARGNARSLSNTQTS